VPVLINTSLNDQSMPIVETPDEAVTLFRRTMIDALVLENKLIERSLES
jgi:carbamoyltransferase